MAINQPENEKNEHLHGKKDGEEHNDDDDKMEPPEAGAVPLDSSSPRCGVRRTVLRTAVRGRDVLGSLRKIFLVIGHDCGCGGRLRRKGYVQKDQTKPKT